MRYASALCIYLGYRRDANALHWMLLAALAMRGHSSADSLATGPVMPLPFISPLLFTSTPALSDGTETHKTQRGKGRMRHSSYGTVNMKAKEWYKYAMVIRCTFKVDEHAMFPAPRLALAHNNSRKYFLAVIRLAFFNGNHHHVTRRACRQAVQTGAPAFHTDNAKLPCTGVIRTV